MSMKLSKRLASLFLAAAVFCLPEFTSGEEVPKEQTEVVTVETETPVEAVSVEESVEMTAEESAAEEQSEMPAEPEPEVTAEPEEPAPATDEVAPLEAALVEELAPGEPPTAAGGGNSDEGEVIRNEQATQSEAATIEDAAETKQPTEKPAEGDTLTAASGGNSDESEVIRNEQASQCEAATVEDTLETEEPAAPAPVETKIDDIKIILTATEGDTPAIRKISDDAMAARVEKAFSPKAEEGQTVRKCHLLLKVSGGKEGGKIKVRMENAGLKKWKQEAGEDAAVNAVVVQADAAKAEKISAAVKWDANEIIFDAVPNTVADVFLTAVIILRAESEPAEPEQTERPEEQTAEGTVPEIPEQAETTEETANEPAAVEEPAGEPPTTASGGNLIEGEVIRNEQASQCEAATIEDAVEIDLPAAPEPVAFDQFLVVDGVKVSVSAAPGVFPAKAKLSVTRVSAAQQAQVDWALDRAQDGRMEVAASYSFDIKILDENGTELQPADGQTVNVSFSLAEVANDNLETTVYHMEEQPGGSLNAERLDTRESGETVTARSDGFSVYTITFSYEERQFAVLANTPIGVSDLVNAVGLTGTVTAAALSAQETGKGVSLSGSEPDWTITAAEQSASEAQKLTVTLQGVDFNILLSVYEQRQVMTPLDYLDENGIVQIWEGGYANVQSATWQSGGGFSGWWTADEDVILEQRVNVYGDVKLVLRDSGSIKVNGGIQVSPGSSLTIYGQGKNNGVLTAVSREPAGDVRATGAAIGGAYSTTGKGNAGTIWIVGGVITATSNAPGCAGIGGGTDGAAPVTITGGMVTATGNGSGAGIGGRTDGTTVTVSGGTVSAKGGRDGVAITGKTATETTDEDVAAAETEETKDPNVIYAPDGTIYDPGTIEVDRSSSGDDSYANLRTEYYDADLEKLYTPQVASSPTVTTSTTGPGSTSVTDSTQQAGPGTTTDGTTETKQKNVLLISVAGAHWNSAVLPILEHWGIVYINPAEIPGGENLEDILQSGMDENAASTAKDLIASFGFELVPENGKDKNSPGAAAVTDEGIVSDAVSWIMTEGSNLNNEGKPFFLSLQLNGTEDMTEAPVGPITDSTGSGDEDPATATDLQGNVTETDVTGGIDNSLETMINALRMVSITGRTVIIVLDRTEGKVIIIHPDRTDGIIASEEAADQDILRTILAVGIENGTGQALPERLKGRDLLSLAQTADEEQ